MRMTRDNCLFQCDCLSLAISSLPLNLKWGYITFINKELCLQNNQIKSAIWFKMDVVTKQYNIFIKCNWCIWTASIKSTISNCSQNDLTYVHDQNIWLTESQSCRQKEQVMSFSIPMCIKTILVAITLCTSLIWNHFSFISWICCIFLKVIHQ